MHNSLGGRNPASSVAEKIREVWPLISGQSVFLDLWASPCDPVMHSLLLPPPLSEPHSDQRRLSLSAWLKRSLYPLKPETSASAPHPPPASPISQHQPETLSPFVCGVLRLAFTSAPPHGHRSREGPGKASSCRAAGGRVSERLTESRRQSFPFSVAVRR